MARNTRLFLFAACTGIVLFGMMGQGQKVFADTSVSPTALTFTMRQGGPDPYVQAVNISGTGACATGPVTGPSQWQVFIYNATGSAPCTIYIGLDGANFAAGTYQYNVPV